MEFQDFHPFLRYINKIKLFASYPQFLRAYDFRLFFVVEGSIVVEFEKTKFQLFEKDLIIFPPGTSYKLILDKNNTGTTHYVLNFDFDENAKEKKARTPVPVKQFNSKEIFSSISVSPFDKPFHLKHTNWAESVLEDISELELTQTLQNCYITALLKYLLIKCILNNTQVKFLSSTQETIENAKKYIRENIVSRPSNDAIAKAIGYHPYYLNSLFVSYEHITLHKYVDSVCLKKAKELLLNTNLSISNIAQQSGFSEGNYFARIFKKNVGLTPTQYREFSK